MREELDWTRFMPERKIRSFVEKAMIVLLV
jgi:hypothetical protein